MEGAQAQIVLPPLLQMYMGRDNVHDICIREDLVHNLLRIIHPNHLPPASWFLICLQPAGGVKAAEAPASSVYSAVYSTDQALGTKSSS